MPERVLTGIKPTGLPHLGNYVGAIRPALERGEAADEAFFFIADYHALNQIQDPRELNLLSYAVAATWLASGLDPSTSHFYRQSDVPETFELSTILSAFTPKGWMNIAHAYKAAVASNADAGRERDHGVNMGLYTYPVLMAADILLFDATVVPVGSDQVQHVEITRDIANRINSHFDDEVFVVPRYEVQEQAEAIPGLDGRKMSKSYDNTIPLFADYDDRKRRVYGIKTDSSGRYDRKVATGAPVYDIYASFASREDAAALREGLEEGQLGWADAKGRLLDLLDDAFAERTERFNELMANRDEIDDILVEGARRIRPAAQQTLERVRQAIGRAGTIQLTYD